jgi:hypothetical protein
LFLVKGKSVLTKSNKGAVTVRTDDSKYASLPAIPSADFSFCRTDVGMNTLSYAANIQRNYSYGQPSASVQAGLQFPAPLHHQQT